MSPRHETRARDDSTEADQADRTGTCGRCGGYHGWWARSLGDGVAWEIDPADTDDGIGYAICGQCTPGAAST